MRINFLVPGIPRPGGSKRAFVNKRTGKAILVKAGGKNEENWRAVVACAARQAYQGAPLDGPIRVSIQFFLPRPKRLMRRKDPPEALPHDHPPDLGKLLRSTEDALTGVLWRDDGQTHSAVLSKMYCAKDKAPGALIEVVTEGK